MSAPKKNTRQKETLIKVLHHLKKYRIYLILSILLAALTVALNLYVPKLTGNAVDLIVSKGHVDFPGVLRIVVQIGVCTLITAAAQWIMSTLNNKMTYQIVADIRNEAFQKIEILPLKYIDEHSNGEIVSRVIADVDQFADGLLMGFTQFFTGVATIVGTLVFMLSINIPITFVVVLASPPFLLSRPFLLPKRPLRCLSCSPKPAASRPPSLKK